MFIELSKNAAQLCNSYLKRGYAKRDCILIQYSPSRYIYTKLIT